jgi:hypothetical protein
MFIFALRLGIGSNVGIVSHHMSVVLSNSSETARTSVRVSWLRSGYVILPSITNPNANYLNSSVLSVVPRQRSTSCSVLLPSRGELVTKHIAFMIPFVADGWTGLDLPI